MTELLQFTLFGLMLGCVYAIAAMGLVLTYTVTGVFNFAHGAVGMMAAFTYFELRVQHGVPTPVAFLVVVFLLAPLMGLVAERLLRRFQGANYATSLVVMVALTVALLGLAQKVFDPGQARNVPYLFGDHQIDLVSVPITYDRIAQVVVAAAVAFGLRYLLFRTPLGARMRAVVDDRDLAQLNGVRSVSVARLSWGIGFCLAALGGVLFAAGHNLNAIVLTLLVLNVYGAAMVGRLTSLPLTFLGALLLGLCQELTHVSWLWPTGDVFIRIQLAIPGIFLVVAVAVVPSFRLSAGRIVGRDQPRVPTLRSSVLGAVALVAAVAVLVNVGDPGLATHVVRALVIATIALSLVAVTGLSGQVSLAQYLFVGVGAFVTGKVLGGDSVVGMLAGGVVAAMLGALVALPGVRLRGLHLALSTFGIALIGREAILGDPRVFGLGGLTVGRPKILGISLESDAAFAVWCALVFGVLAIGVGMVRRGWFGRSLTAVRDSEVAAATLGMRVRAVKVAIFAFSAFIAGCAGALFGGLTGAVTGIQFEPIASLVIVLFAYVGGITTAFGALLAGALFAVLVYAESTYADLAGLVFVAIGAAAISLGRQPNGVAGLLLEGIERVRTRASAFGRSRLAWRAAALLFVLVAVAGFGRTGATARAQEGPSLGGMQGSAISSGLYVFYTPKGLLPIGSIVDLGAPDALATIASGPATFARASVADPGDIVANPDAVLALASAGYPQGTVPPYPYRVTATSGFGAPKAESSPAPGLNAQVDAEPQGSTARATMPAADAPAIATFGSLSALATTQTDGSKVTVRVRTKVSDFKLLDIVTIDSIATNLTAVSDGKKTIVTGGSVVSGAAVLGRAVTIDATGVQGSPALNDALARAGIRVTLPVPVKQQGATAGQIASSGIRIDLELSDRTVPVLASLAKAVPPVPDLAPGSPTVADVLAAARAQHLSRLELARGAVSLSARPGFEAGAVDLGAPFPGDASGRASAIGGTGALGSAGGVASVGTTTSPRTPARVSRPLTERAREVPLGVGIGAVVLLAILVQPFLGAAVARMATTVLAAGESASCPQEERSP